MEETPVIGRVLSELARLQVELGTGGIVAASQGAAGGAFEQFGCLFLIRHGLPELAENSGAERVFTQLDGSGRQFNLSLGRPGLFDQLMQLPTQFVTYFRVARLVFCQGIEIVELGQLPEQPQRLPAQCRITGVEGRLQGFAGGGGAPGFELLMRQQQAQLWVVRVAAQQVGQIGGRQRTFLCGGQAAFKR